MGATTLARLPVLASDPRVDSLCNAAARALEHGDALAALKYVALRDDPPALALRGIALAQLSDFENARRLLRRGARGFGDREPLARSRCIVAAADVAFATRELDGGDGASLTRAIETLTQRGDHENARFARLVAIRRALLVGRVDDAARARAALELDGASPRLVAIAELAAGEIAIRKLRAADARSALLSAERAAQRAGIAALLSEIESALASLDALAARWIRGADVRPLRLAEIEEVFASGDLLVDACRRSVRDAGGGVDLRRRPVLFALVRTLAEAWPHEAARDALIATAFGARRPNESHRARLRVEIGRLRRALAAHATLSAGPTGFSIAPKRARSVSVLAPPIDGDDAALLALLADGAAWSTSALALALGKSQRSVQRSLSALESSSQVRPLGSGRSRRWLARPVTGITTALLLPLPRALG